MMEIDKYKGVTFQGSTFPDAPYRDIKPTMTKELVEEYIPAAKRILAAYPKGLRVLLTAMADMEGFYKGSRSYRTKNPGNIGNTDAGTNAPCNSFEDGIIRQKAYIDRIISGKHKSYPLNQKVVLPPFYSKEIAKNPKVYGLPPYLPGYEFIFTGQLDQFVKIYSTGARVTNVYIDNVVAFFNAEGLTIYPHGLIQDMVKMS